MCRFCHLLHPSISLCCDARAGKPYEPKKPPYHHHYYLTLCYLATSIARAASPTRWAHKCCNTFLLLPRQNPGTSCFTKAAQPLLQPAKKPLVPTSIPASCPSASPPRPAGCKPGSWSPSRYQFYFFFSSPEELSCQSCPSHAASLLPLNIPPLTPRCQAAKLQTQQLFLIPPA